jgi:mediator of RNA polymerase II transcription subunit 10
LVSFPFQVKGKIDAYRMFKAKLLVELSNVFPKEINHYRALRGDERVAP